MRSAIREPDIIELLARLLFERGEYAFDCTWDDLPETEREYPRAAVRHAVQLLGGVDILQALCKALVNADDARTGRV